MKLKTVWYKWANIQVDVFNTWIFSACVFWKCFHGKDIDSVIINAKHYIEEYIRDEVITFDDLVNLTQWLIYTCEWWWVDWMGEDWFKVIIDKYIKSSKCE